MFARGADLSIRLSGAGLSTRLTGSAWGQGTDSLESAVPADLSTRLVESCGLMPLNKRNPLGLFVLFPYFEFAAWVGKSPR